MMRKDICHGSGQPYLTRLTDSYHAIVSWNQSEEEFLKLKRSTIAYYIGDMVRKHKPTVTK